MTLHFYNQNNSPFTMFKLFKEFYIIKLFPKSYPFYKKIFCNVLFFFSRIIIHQRENELSSKDLLKANLLLRKGDIVLCGEHETILSLLIHDPVNHAAIYVGKRRFVEAIGKGVEYVSFHKLFTAYHSLVILRAAKGTKRIIIRNAVKFAKSTVGQPYNYEFLQKGEGYFCSQLVNEAYRSAGYNTNLTSISLARTTRKRLEEKLSKAADALRPARMVKGNFRIIFVSHNLKLKGKKLFTKK